MHVTTIHNPRDINVQLYILDLSETRGRNSTDNNFLQKISVRRFKVQLFSGQKFPNKSFNQSIRFTVLLARKHEIISGENSGRVKTIDLNDNRWTHFIYLSKSKLLSFCESAWQWVWTGFSKSIKKNPAKICFRIGDYLQIIIIYR